MSYYDEPEIACEICGKDPGDCVCPECPLCGVTGDPDCYGKFGHLPRAAMQAAPDPIDELSFADWVAWHHGEGVDL